MQWSSLRGNRGLFLVEVLAFLLLHDAALRERLVEGAQRYMRYTFDEQGAVGGLLTSLKEPAPS